MNLEKSELIHKRSVRLHKDHLHESGRYVGKVEQRVKNTGNIIADILEDGCPFSDGELFFAAMVFRSAWLKALENGYGVDMFEMGTMYLAADDTFSEDAYVMGEDEKKNMPRLTARFSVSKLAKEAAAKVQIDADDIRRADSLPFIENITNWREKKREELFTGDAVEITGTNLKIVGKGAGVFFVPVQEDGWKINDESKWHKAERLDVNFPKRLWFYVPESVTAGKYKIIVRTKFNPSYKERKDFVECESVTVEVVENS